MFVQMRSQTIIKFEMQGNLLELLKINTFSVQLTMLLERVSKFFAHMLQIYQQNKKSNKQSIPLSTIKQMEHHLISLTCQNKNLLHYKYLENKLNNEHCIAYIVEILTYTSKIYPGSSQHISSSFISHILSHMSCYISFYTFLMVLENNQQIVNQIPYSKLLDINLKIQKQENIFDDIKMLHSIQLLNHEIFARDHLQICEKNLNHYLQQREKPSRQFKNTQTIPEKQEKSIQIKIPPLILPTSKSINSERFSAISKEEKPKGMEDLLKLATGLGENFITVELGCLLASKRTRQVQQYSQNQSFRQKCIQKIQKIHTQRMNSSRMNIEHLQGPANETYPLKDKLTGQENTKKYYSKVFAANLNIFLKKIKLEKQTHTFFEFISEFIRKMINHKKHNDEPIKERFFVSVIEMLKQVIDMTVVGGLMLNEQELEDDRLLKSDYQMHNISVFTLLLKNMKPTRQIAKQLANILSLESEKLHKYLLINQNKRNKAFHYDYETVQLPLNQHYLGLSHQETQLETCHDQFLNGIIVKVNEPAKKKGPFKLYSDKKQKQSEFLMHIKRNSDPILLYISNFLQSLQQSADMNHPLFYNYQTNTLRVLNFYLKVTLQHNKASVFYVTEFLTPLLIMLKRQLLELSHPYFEKEQADYNINSSNTISSISHIDKKKAKGFFRRKQNNSQRHIKPLVFTNPELMAEYIKLITNLLESGLSHQDHSTYSKRNKYVEKLIANLYIKNIYFMELLENFTQYIFANKSDNQIAIILNFYRTALQVYTQSNSSKSKHGSQEHRHLRYLYQHLASYLQPKTGCIAKILNNYEKFISPETLEQAEAEEINLSDNPPQKASSGIQYILHEILQFIASIYYISSPDSNEALILLEEQIASFYIKYSIMGFIKLYSLLTVTELVNINTNKGSGMKKQIQFILSTKQSPHSSSEANVKQIFMIDFLKILTNMSINRTPEIAKKFREYRVLEFFVREIQLEFSVSENIEKYIRKGKEVQHFESFKQQIMPFQTEIDHRCESSSEDQIQESYKSKCPPLQLNIKPSKNEKQKKISVPGLNLTGKLFQKGSVEDSPQSKSIQENLNIFQPSTHKGKPVIQKLPLKTEENSHFSSKNTYKQETGHRKKGLLDDTIEQIVKHKKKGEKSQKKTGKDRKKSAKASKSIKTETNPNNNLNLALNLNLDNLKLKSRQVEHDTFGSHGKTTAKNSDTQLIYQTERKIRKIYSNKLLHSESILLILSLILYRGQLDPLYCDQMPIIHGKLNVLYLLHYHLNHESNKSILPILAENVKKIKPYLSGQRIFKLLSNAYTDLSQYHSWTKLNAGAFGVVMRANTYLDNPQEVAVKQMNFPKSIYQRCVLHDIFTEITCLQMFRLEERVTKMYNYGVIDNTYVIVMKKYACSVRDWRLGNVQNSITNNFPPTLPNILALFYSILKGLKFLHDHNVTHYDIKGDNILLDFGDITYRQSALPKAVFADFGVCKSYEDQKDQLDLKSRGTQCIKSPEMLTLTLKNKKEADNYDRRKKIGTTKASDIWSLGCLLYELVTGEYLFNSNDWVHFFMQVTSPTEQILNQQQCQRLNNNVYLIDFLKYILIRDPQHRPSIHNIISRFENLYALLVSNPERFTLNELKKCSKKSLNDSVLKYIEAIIEEQKYLEAEAHQEVQKGKKKEKNPVLSNKEKKQIQLEKPEKGITKSYGKMMKIMEDIYICDNQKYLLQHQGHIRNQGVTHIILLKGTNFNPNTFKVFEIDLKANKFLETLMYRLCPRISDCLREVLLLKGKLLFVNNETNYAANLLIFMLSYWFKCSIYETWCLINTQILSFPILASNKNLGTMSKMLTHLNEIQTEAQSFPKLQCICGSVTIILKKKFQEKKGELRPCKCNKKSIDKSQCLSRNCPEYLQFIKKRYNIIWDNLTWALINPQDLLTSLSRDNESSLDSMRSNIILNSAHPIENMFYEENQSGGYKVASCRVCEMWMMSFKENETWVILNNLIKSFRQGIMIPNAQQEFKMRTPALNYFTLSKLHMTQ